MDPARVDGLAPVLQATSPAGDTFKACNARAHGKLDVVPIDLIRQGRAAETTSGSSS